MRTTATSEFQVTGTNELAAFTLKIHRGEGMALLAMNWKTDLPPDNFVGFAIEYTEPGGTKWYAVNNRLAFPSSDGSVSTDQLSSKLSPIQKFRWVHFPRNADMKGTFTYRVTPVFMDAADELSYGEFQEAGLVLMRETYTDQLNVAFARGFVLSQGFVDKFEKFGRFNTLLPRYADEGFTFKPTHPKTQDALEWMGFEARKCLLEVLDDAAANVQAKVYVVAYDLCEPEILKRLKQLGNRLQIIIDNAGTHGPDHSAESQAYRDLVVSAGAENVKRQKMGGLQHNKTIVVDAPGKEIVVCGSTNFSWRGLYVQNNNAVILKGKNAMEPFKEAFDNYWNNGERGIAHFSGTGSTNWIELGLDGIDAKVSFSPHAKKNALLAEIAKDLRTTESSLFYSLAFLYQTKGITRDAIKTIADNSNIFVYGISDKSVKELEIMLADGNLSPVSPEALAGNVPQPFKAEPKAGKGNRMHHKFLVIDFDKPTARVYTGSYNFSIPADTANGENLLLIKDRKIATSYMIEALRMFDHYQYRVLKARSTETGNALVLRKPPRTPEEIPWWKKDYTVAVKIKDRKLFA